MAKCTCNKEKEIAEIHTDVRWIKKALEGNGERGIISKVHDNSKFRHEHEAQAAQRKMWIGAGWFTTIILFIISILLRTGLPIK